MSHLKFRSVTTYPKRVDGTAVLTRLIDGLGYRFFWATEGLREQDYNFYPGNNCKTIGELIKHIWGLVNWIHLNIIGHGNDKERPKDITVERNHVLDVLGTLRDYFQELSDDELVSITIEKKPFWHLINGPFSDALTHVGQINSFRRLAGNKTQKCSVFTLKAPEDNK